MLFCYVFRNFALVNSYLSAIDLDNRNDFVVSRVADAWRTFHIQGNTLLSLMFLLPMFSALKRHMFSWNAGEMSSGWIYLELSLCCVACITFHFGAFTDWGTLKPRNHWYCCKRCKTSHECMGSAWPVCHKCRLAQGLEATGSASTTHCNRCDRCFTESKFHCKFFGTCMDKFGFFLVLISTLADTILITHE